MSKVLLICNGEKPGPWLKKIAREVDFVLAADGGANHALALGIEPNAIIGDLDSVSPRTRRQLKDIPFVSVSRQDNTDLEKALDWIVKQGFEECFIAGATGNRMDHTLGNFISVYPYLKNLSVRFCGPTWTIYPLIHSFKFSARKGARLSFIPLTDCKDVTLTGVKYRVKNACWLFGKAGLSISNQITAKQSEITFSKGYLLMYLEQ